MTIRLRNPEGSLHQLESKRNGNANASILDIGGQVETHNL